MPKYGKFDADRDQRLTNRQKTTSPGVETHSTTVGGSLLGLSWVAPSTADISPLLQTPISLGRDSSSDVTLNGDEVSRRHARLLREGPLWVLEDVGSRNGTFVNGRRIERSPIERGDVLRLGDCVGVVVRTSQDAVAPAFGRIAENLFGGATMFRIMQEAKHLATSTLPIIVEGETGTGKESVARAIHAWSARSGPFLAVNCAALPEQLAEAQLFGHERGAFTGAVQPALGHFRAAHGGTLFLDEVAELPLAVQAKLLRALERSEVTPLGSVQQLSVDVRVICAAQEPLAQLERSGAFRPDLYARLNGYTVEIPPLRERIEDVPPLFQHFVEDETGGVPHNIEFKCVERLCLYDYPLNVRELQLLARQLVVLHGHESSLKVKHLPTRIREFKKPTATAEPTKRERKNAHELDLLISALRQHQGNLSVAARVVGLSRQRAYRLLEGHPELNLAAMRERQEGQ